MINMIGNHKVNILMNPLYSALKRFAFFRVSKLTHRRPERQCNPARDRNPAKGKPLLRQGTDGNFKAQWI
ncbi:MAG: hypothetical protein C4B57_06505 [Deltaproteobacteria bacterium]|nr:MAG: hypothetical protein C4B57_06505 [Deltaproteobacteria bacterium]